jgi:predicted nucleotidyltransferase
MSDGCMTEIMAENITYVIHAHARVDAIYLYGSRAKQTAHEHSDWDIAVLFILHAGIDADFVKS